MKIAMGSRVLALGVLNCLFVSPVGAQTPRPEVEQENEDVEDSADEPPPGDAPEDTESVAEQEERAEPSEGSVDEDEDPTSDERAPGDEEGKPATGAASSKDDKDDEPVQSAEAPAGAPTDEPAPRPTESALPSANPDLTEEAARAALVDAPDPSPSLTPIDWTTSTWSRFELRENYDDLGVSRGRFSEGDFVVFRARLGMATNPLPIADGSDVSVQFTPQASGMWGTNGTIGEANLGIYEGYFKIRTRRLDVQVGRQKMAYGDDLLIGSLGWHQTARAFDGVRAHYKMDHGFLDLFATQVAEGFPSGGPTFLGGDDYFWGAYLGVGHYFDEDMDLDAYFLVRSDVRQQGLTNPATSMTYDREAAHLMTGGLRVKNQVGSFHYRLETGVQFGNRPGELVEGTSPEEVQAVESLAYHADLELGVRFPGGLRIALGGLIASGDDPDTERDEGFDHLYPTGHKFLGLMDVVGDRTNVASGNLKLRRPITPSLKVLLDAHAFFRLEEGGLGAQAGETGFAGTEIDAQLVQALGQFASVRGLYGVFIPTSGHYQGDDVAHYFELQSGVQF